MIRRVSAGWRTKHREVFFAHNGPGPYPCHFCGKPVSFDEVLVHHHDDDHANNEPANLKASHHSCHSGHHGKENAGRVLGPPSVETREKLRATTTAYHARRRAAGLNLKGKPV
jgi:5-methylcytosine-specific restriction endonuclease McrA